MEERAGWGRGERGEGRGGTEGPVGSGLGGEGEGGKCRKMSLTGRSRSAGEGDIGKGR